LKELEKEMEKNHISLRSKFQNEIPSFFNHNSVSFDKELEDFNGSKKSFDN
jgi:hypothetical protein